MRGYLAVTGLEVAVLEASSGPGGNTRTEELTLPGFAHDSCSSAHVLIQANPLVADDELGLLGRYGLEYLLTDPAVALPQPDGDSLVVRRDLDATVEEVARWSAEDATALRTLVTEWSGGLGAVHARWSSALPLGEGDEVRAFQALAPAAPGTSCTSGSATRSSARRCCGSRWRRSRTRAGRGSGSCRRP